MKIKMITLLACAGLLLCCACGKELVEYRSGDLKVSVEKGSEWLHDFPLFMGIERKNAPQIAVWMEDTEGRYLGTVYVTHRIATQSWIASGGDRRASALPHWCHKRGVKYDDGLYLPTKKEPLTDGISGATPRGSFAVKLTPAENMKRFVVKVEINHSTDFNETYPKDAAPGTLGYSGGSGGSGQPALVYEARIELGSGQQEFPALLVGHSSPDGSDGGLYPDLNGLTTALHIAEHITVNVQP